MYKHFVYIIFAMVVFGCDTHTEDVKLASVEERVLYLSDLTAFLPDNLSAEDSAAMAQDFIRNWVRKELVLNKAEENLSENNKNVQKELEEYRQSLITYKYKKELVRQKMDTTVTEEQILDYYTKNQSNFLLRNNIVKAVFIKIPNEFAEPDRLKSLCNENTEESLNELNDFCIRYAKSYDIFDNRWVNFNVVSTNIPEEITNPERYLARNKVIETRDSSYYYLAYINDFKLTGQTAPVEHVSENIKNLILNIRKIDFLKDTEEEIYQEGIRSKKFKIHNFEN